MLHQVRDLTIIVRNRKLKPEKGRRKDLRKIDRTKELSATSWQPTHRNRAAQAGVNHPCFGKSILQVRAELSEKRYQDILQ
jgi:hypothetical protein